MALWRLAARGAPALGIEQFAPGHDRGAGHGESRIIRTAYAEGPEYVPLVQEAFGLWHRLEEETGTLLLTMTGGLMIGRPDTHLVRGALETARLHGLTHEVLDARAMAARYPQFRLHDDEVALFEANAGFLRPELAIVTAARRACELGARIVTGTRVDSISSEGGGAVTVRAGEQAFEGRHAVVSGGAWNPMLLPDPASSIVVERRLITWFEPDDVGLFAPGRLPIFMWRREGIEWYGVPSIDGATVKVSVHLDGKEPGAGIDPDQLDREVRDRDVELVTRIVEGAIPDLRPAVARSQVCMYALTPDRHFMVGRPAGMPGVTFLGGFSGHGFKFAPIIGDIGADLALEGGTARSIASFDPNRFSAATA